MIRESNQSSGAVRVLIADDQPAFLALLRQMLDGRAGEILECGDGAEAVRLFERHQPDWTLLDWCMPGLDGLAATRAILRSAPQARVILLSAHTTPALAREALAAGAQACLAKNQVEAALALLRQPAIPGEPPAAPRQQRSCP